ncbi:MAG: hypothetical protein IPP83_08790 [Flavobacteriales bacterium]|nr:hypothetical protein [Flavobacteriales bacterium]
MIPLSEIRLRFPDMHRSRLSQWQRRGLLFKVRNGFYRLAGRQQNDHERWAIANAIYTPSYVSMHTALAHYSFIPEGVFHVESVTTSHTRRFTFDGTDYSYRNVRPSFFFGYRFLEHSGVRAMMAGPEKALLDLLYLEPDVNGVDGFEAWRLNADEILDRIDRARMDDFARVEGSRALLTRYRRLNKWLNDHA